MSDRSPADDSSPVSRTMERLSTDRVQANVATEARVATEIAVLREQIAALREAIGIKFSEKDEASGRRDDNVRSLAEGLAKTIDLRLSQAEATGALRFNTLTDRITALRAERVEAVSAALETVAARMNEHRLAHDKEHEQDERAADKLEVTIGERFAQANNFRKQIEAERIDYVRRDILDHRAGTIETSLELLRVDTEKRLQLARDEIDKKIDPLTHWRNTQSGKQETGGAVWAVAVGVGTSLFVAFVIIIVNLLLA